MKRLLLIKLSACGDVVHSLPAAAALAAAGWELHWLVEPRAASLVRACPVVARTWEVPRRRRFPWIAPPALRALAAALRRADFQAVLDLQGLAKSALWTLWAGLGRPRVGFAAAREAAPLVYTRRVAAPVRGRHAVRRYLAAAAALGAKAGPVRFPLEPPPAARAEAAALLAPLPGRFAVVLPGAGKAANRWPTERWGLVARRLRGAGLGVALCGGPDDGGRAAAILRAVPDARDLTGRTSWLGFAALAERAALVLGHDSGPLHLASARGTPTLALFGPASPLRTSPWAGWALGAQIGCAPCCKRRCPLGEDPPPCQLRLPPEAVWTVAEALLAGREPRLPGAGLWLRRPCAALGAALR